MAQNDLHQPDENENATSTNEELNENNNETNENNNEPVDNRSKLEKFGDAVENVFDEAQEALYGENPNFTEDIPATMEDGNGIRQINKVQTRRNFNRKVVFANGRWKKFLAIFVIGGIVCAGYYIINALLLA